MCLNGAVLAAASIQPGVGTDPVAAKEGFNDILSDPDVHLLLDIFMWNRIILGICADVVVVLHGGNSPCGQLKGLWRQWKQKRFFLFKNTGSTTVLLLKGLVVKFS